jgi:extracellular elastinolytic metalloproteinase
MQVNYRYGFTEKTFNFQNDNGSNGGKGNDRVLVSVQDSSGTNNANFATPADGSSGQMRM